MKELITYLLLEHKNNDGVLLKLRRYSCAYFYGRSFVYVYC